MASSSRPFIDHVSLIILVILFHLLYDGDVKRGVNCEKYEDLKRTNVNIIDQLEITNSLSNKLSALNFKLTNCSFKCFLDRQDELKCLKTSGGKFVHTVYEMVCQVDVINRIFLIKGKSSVRRIAFGGLAILNQPLTLVPAVSDNLVSVVLHINIMELNSNAFVGLENSLGSVHIQHVVSLHPDTFFNQTRLASFSIESKQIPKIPSSITSRIIEHNYSAIDIPLFLRFKLKDNNALLSINFDVQCHRCLSTNMSNAIAIITFKKTKAVIPDIAKIDALSLIHIDSCFSISEGLGCPWLPQLNQTNETRSFFQLFSYVITDTARNGWNIDHKQYLNTNNQHFKNANIPVIQFLIIWCSLITVLLIFLCTLLFIRRYKVRKTLNIPQKNKKNRAQMISCEELTYISDTSAFKYSSQGEGKYIHTDSPFRKQYNYQNEMQPMMCNQTSMSAYSILPTHLNVEQCNGYEAHDDDNYQAYSENEISPAVNYDENLTNGYYRKDLPEPRILLDDNIVKAVKPQRGGVYALNHQQFQYVAKPSLTPKYRRSQDGTFKLS